MTRASLAVAPRRGADELAFLPAALEIVETPPTPWASAIGGSLIALFCLALIWAWFGTVDIIASATGKIVPNGRAKIIQPFETGVVSAIHVGDGDRVKAGDLLFELDSTSNDADRNHLQTDLVSAQLDVARLTAALSGAPDPVKAFQPPEGASEELAATQRRFLAQQMEEHRAKIAALDGQKSQKQAELNTTLATLAKLDAMLPLLQERVNIKQTLYSHDLSSKVSYLEILQSLVEAQQERSVQQSRSREASAALGAIEEARAQTMAEFYRSLSGELVEAQRKASGLKEDLIKATQRTRLQRLAAPIDGVVQQLAIHTVGGVVTPAQALLVLVPDDQHLEIEAMVSNHDIGFVHVGQDAEIKIDTFSFTRYGLIHGHVISISGDSILRDRPQDRGQGSGFAGATGDSSEPKGQELAYSARVSLDQEQMQIDETMVKLTPGMAVTVEIKTGSRSIISYLLSPLLRYKQESLRER